MSSLGSNADSELPDVDDRIVAPESRYEIDDGKLVYVSPADPPHAERHSQLAAVLHAHVAPEFKVALDMLTRTSKIDDIAPDASIFPRAKHPETGRRQLEHVAFEIAVTQALGDSGRKAAKLIARGVRRVFVIDVERERVLEWSRELATWSILESSSSIVDQVFAVPVPIASLLELGWSDDVVAAAMLAKGNDLIETAIETAHTRGQLQGRAEAILVVLAARGIEVDAAARSRILAERDLERLDRWLAAASHAASASELIDR